MNWLQKALIAVATDYLDSYVTVAKIASDYGVSEDAMEKIIRDGFRLRDLELMTTGHTCGKDNFREYVAGIGKEMK